MNPLHPAVLAEAARALPDALRRQWPDYRFIVKVGERDRAQARTTRIARGKVEEPAAHDPHPLIERTDNPTAA